MSGDQWAAIGVQASIGIALVGALLSVISRLVRLEEAKKGKDYQDKTRDNRLDKHSIEFKKIGRRIDSRFSALEDRLVERLEEAIRKQHSYRIRRDDPPDEAPRIGDAS